MRPGPVICLCLGLVGPIALVRADPALQEYSDTVVLRPATELVAGSCELDVQLHGAIVDAELHQELRGGPVALAAVYELELPATSRVIDFALRDRTTAVGVGVPTQSSSEVVGTDPVLGADPAILTLVGPGDGPRLHYRAIVQPFGARTTLAVRWTDVAGIYDGMLHVHLLGHPEGSPCQVRVSAQPGPGARIGAIRAGTTVLSRAHPTFELGADDVDLEIDLAIAGHTPVAWLQSSEAGLGFTAQALTVVAPPLRAETGARHVVLVIDTSRSMDLVGRPNVRKLVRAIGRALPRDAQVEAIVYDRTATRVLGGWRPATTATFDTLDAALAARPAVNGSDLVAALALAHPLVTEPGRGQAMVVAISDGVLGARDEELIHALDARIDQVDLHAITLEPHGLHGLDADELAGAVRHFGGTSVEVDVEEIDRSVAPFGGAAGPLGALASWLRPAWLELSVPGFDVPDEIRAGAGFVTFAMTPRAVRPVLAARGDAPVHEAARAAPTAPIIQLALDRVGADAFGTGDAGTHARDRLATLHPAVDDAHDLAVLTAVGRIAASRHRMVAGGGPFTRLIAIPDPAFVPRISIGHVVGTARSALDRGIVKRLLVDQLQPRAYSCYVRALGPAPRLAGTVQFRLDLGRGEVSRVELAGLGNAGFDACLLEAAYGLTPPLPTPGVNLDDRTIVRYPLTFSVREDKPLILPGDADSSSPLDIDAIPGGAPHRLDLDTRTPLGGLPPSRHP